MTRPPRPFCERLRPAPRLPAFSDAQWWTWCGSVIRGDDGRLHLLASRWPRCTPFFNGYLSGSRIVHAVARNPLGPFEFVRQVLPTGETDGFDADMAHNPAIIRMGDRYWMFYIGLAHGTCLPALTSPFASWSSIYRRIRIGVASDQDLDGLWERCPRPVIDTDVAPWPHLVTTNPAPVITPQGRVRVYYRTPRQEGDRIWNVLAVAEAEHPLGPYRSLCDQPLLPPEMHLEDPHVWWNGSEYEALAKDLDGNIAGQLGAAVHLRSDDGLKWRLAEPATAYRRELCLDDGTTLTLGNLERPWLLRDEQGKPEVLYAAAGDDPRGFDHATRTWLQAIPLD